MIEVETVKHWIKEEEKHKYCDKVEVIIDDVTLNT